MGKRRVFSRDFKLSLLRELDQDRSMSQLCREHNIHSSLISKWRREYDANPSEAFSGQGNTYKLEAKLAQRDRLIGELYVESAFLKKALNILEKKYATCRSESGGKTCTR